MIYLIAFATSFLFIALRSTQQLNVMKRKYWWIVPTSMLMAACEVWIISTAATKGIGWFVIPIGLGGGLGSLCATWLHYKLTEK